MPITKIKTFVLVLFSLICFTVQANVVSDFKAGIPLDKAIQKALNQGISVSEIITPLIVKAKVSPIVATKAVIQARNPKVVICHKQKNTLIISLSALQAHVNHGDVMGACNATESEKASASKMMVRFEQNQFSLTQLSNSQLTQSILNEAINVVIAATLASPRMGPEILTSALENIEGISLENAALLTLTAMVLVPEQKKAILKAASDKNTKLGDKVNFLETTTFKNGFHSTENYTLSKDTGGCASEGNSAQCFTITITTTGSQISVSPHR